MTRTSHKIRRKITDNETGGIPKKWKKHINIALIYPNTYHVGMSNLGFQAVYELINSYEDVLCERSFLWDDDGSAGAKPITTVESGKDIRAFDIVAFSVSYENDFPNLLAILEKAKFPLQSNDRGTPHPLVIAGGVAFFLNPEPLAPFIDCFLIGEAEAVLPKFLAAFSPEILARDRKSCLHMLARDVPGVYVPSFYKAKYRPDGILGAFEPLSDVPVKVERQYAKNISHTPTCSAIITPNTIFDSTFLIEVSRGCTHGCRFCAAGFVYRPPRFRPFSLLKECMDQGASKTNKIGLVGAAVSDLPDLDKICGKELRKNSRVSFSSLRADALTPKLLAVLKESKTKTATIAPDAGSERMRQVINKGIDETDILDAVEQIVAADILNIKLYFMVGLPTETMEDVEAISALCKKVKHRFLKSSRAKKRMGEITVSLSSFVPKPFTPFQWVKMDDIQSLREKIKRVKNGLKKVANVRVHADIPRWAYIQGLLSRGDRRVAQLLSLVTTNRGNWPKTLKSSPINADFYVLRERSLNELLPWDFIDHGIRKSFLKTEYKRALRGKTSPPCPVESCSICGVCKEKNEENASSEV